MPPPCRPSPPTTSPAPPRARASTTPSTSRCRASKYPETTDHISDAVAAGQPSLLHIDRADEDAHRDASLADYPPRTGYDRDEYPPAMSREGGAGADVRYIDPSDNRGAGSTMGNALEGWCEDQPFRLDITP